MLPPRGTPGVEIADLGEVLATIGHALAYAALTALAVASQRAPRVWLTLAVVVGYGILLEVLQGIVGLRSFQVSDIAANSLGAVIGMTAAMLIRRSAP